MSAMLREVLRWRGGARCQFPARRWLGWAQRLGERYGRIFQRHSDLSMTLMQPPALLYSCCQRWEHVAWSLYPQIKLAIHPILQQTVWHAAPPSLVDHQVFALSPSIRLENPATKRWLEWRPQRVKSARGEDSVTGIKQAQGPENPLFAWGTPLKRVFTRFNIEHLDEGVTVSRVHRENLPLEQTQRIVRRVLNERQRIETRTAHQAMVIRRQQEMTPAISVSEKSPMAMNSPWGLKVGTPGMSQPLPPLPMDIERLTEQVVRHIDQKIVAHRERMGRVF
jgi:hypothetical protein